MAVRADELEMIRMLLADKEKTGNPDSIAPVLAARDATFYNYAMSDSVLHYAPVDMKRLLSMGKWKQYYEVWMYKINTLIYYNNLKNMALREVQAMYEDAMNRGDDYGMGIAYYTMGNVYMCMGSLVESADAFNKGLDILTDISPLPTIVPELFSNYGDVLNDQKQYGQLKELTVRWKTFLNALLEEKKYVVGNKEKSRLTVAEQDILWFYYDIACTQAAIGLGNTEQADQLLQNARKHIPDGLPFLEKSWLSHMTQLRYKQGRYAEAFELSNKRIAMVQPDEDKYAYIGDLVQRAEILNSLGNYEQTAALYKDLYQTIDSINRADTKSQLTEMNTIFEVNDLKMKQERAQFRLLMIIVGIIVLALVVFIVFRTIAARHLKRAHQKLQETHEELLTAYDQLEETTTAKERIESDLRIARNIQMGMVPHVFPDRKDLDLYASMTPAKEVGGDLYGYLLSDDKLYFCLGDVSGKGVPASLFMAQATRLFRTLAAQQLMPAQIATQINEALSGEDNETNMFVTMFIGLLDLTSGHLDFCNAGHNPPVLLRNGKPEFIKMVPNVPIGLCQGLDFIGETIDDITDCPFFVYTDGLNEAENRQFEQFSDERLLDILEKTPFESCQQTVELLRDEVERHRDGAEPNDDLTMLCVRYIKIE
jgi:serine phosphatase RsbU (regulator of sigma subunit)